jgi:hypothetical protein
VWDLVFVALETVMNPIAFHDAHARAADAKARSITVVLASVLLVGCIGAWVILAIWALR